jgi:hypothetical protein
MRSLLPLKTLLATRKDDHDSFKGFSKNAVRSLLPLKTLLETRKDEYDSLKGFLKEAVFASFKNPFSDKKRRPRLVQMFFKGCGLCYL